MALMVVNFPTFLPPPPPPSSPIKKKSENMKEKALHFHIVSQILSHIVPLDGFYLNNP